MKPCRESFLGPKRGRFGQRNLRPCQRTSRLWRPRRRRRPPPIASSKSVFSEYFHPSIYVFITTSFLLPFCFFSSCPFFSFLTARLRRRGPDWLFFKFLFFATPHWLIEPLLPALTIDEFQISNETFNLSNAVFLRNLNLCLLF